MSADGLNLRQRRNRCQCGVAAERIVAYRADALAAFDIRKF
jgi:hypothetical protein